MLDAEIIDAKIIRKPCYYSAAYQGGRI